MTVWKVRNSCSQFSPARMCTRQGLYDFLVILHIPSTCLLCLQFLRVTVTPLLLRLTTLNAIFTRETQGAFT